MPSRMQVRSRNFASARIGRKGGRGKLTPDRPETESLKLLDVLPVLVWRSGRDARCDYFNQSWLDFTGRRLEQELGDGWAEGVHPEDRGRCVKDYLEAFEARRPFVIEYRLRHRDGEYRLLRDIGRPCFTVSGEFTGYIGGCIDVTEREKTAEALRQALEERERLFRDLHDGIVQKTYAIGMGLEETRRNIPDNPAAAREQLSAAIAGLNEVIREVRGHISGLPPAGSVSRQLSSEIQALVRIVGRARRPQFRVEVDARAASRLSPQVSSQVLNIVREAMSNSLRHSRGTRGLVSLRRHRDCLRVVIEDDGLGLNKSRANTRGRGLRNIAARADELSARLDVRSRHGGGTRITVDIPVEIARGEA